MAQPETLQAFARELHELEQKYSLRITGFYSMGQEIELVDQDDMDFYYVSKVE